MSTFEHYAEGTLRSNGIKLEAHRVAITKCLKSLYDSKDRFYHNSDHVVNIFTTAKSMHIELNPKEKLAILFHDVIYIPKKEFNEENSANFMMSLMSAYGVHLNDQDLSFRIVIETANFLNNVMDEKTHMVLDLDLSSMAKPYDEFIKNDFLLRQEFNASINDRKNFLRMFLEKRIYYKLIHLENKTRENIMRYIEEA